MDDGTVARIKNDEHSYNFSFYDDKLYLINPTYLIPTNAIENEETWATEMLEYYDVPGIDTTINKINETTYEMKQTCNITEILKAGSKNVCSMDYFGEEIFGLAKTEIENQYHRDACK